MAPFLHAHATHPDWRMALALAAAQIDAARAQRGIVAASAEPNLGFVYFSDHYAAQAQALFADLRARWPDVQWVGTVGVGVAASGVEYFDEPALTLMLARLPEEGFRVFSGARPLAGFAAESALVHADPATPDLAELLGEMSERTASGYLFGGLASSRSSASHLAEGVFEGGLSGVAFGRELGLISRITQGCQPVGPSHRITAAQRNVVTELDGEPALDVMLRDLALSLEAPREALLSLRGTLVGLSAGEEPGATPRRHSFGDEVRVRHLIGLDPGQRGVAVAELMEPGMRLAFCRRDVEAARRDLVRICSEIREELAPEPALAAVGEAADCAPVDPLQRVAGAIYVSCAGRGGPHFGGPSAEMQILRHALGDVPLVGFFAGGEIGHRHLYGYTGVLTVFTRDA